MGKSKKLKKKIKHLQKENDLLKEKSNFVTPAPQIQVVKSQPQQTKGPAELQQVYVRKLFNAVSTLLQDFAAAEQKCKEQRKKEKDIEIEIENFRKSINPFPIVDNPNFIKYKEMKWKLTKQIKCDQYFEILNSLKDDNKEIVATLKVLQKSLNRALNNLVAVQPLPDSMKVSECKYD